MPPPPENRRIKSFSYILHIEFGTPRTSLPFVCFGRVNLKGAEVSDPSPESSRIKTSCIVSYLLLVLTY